MHTQPLDLPMPRISRAKTVGWEGLEPSTNALKGHCSTIELPTPSTRRSAERECVLRASEDVTQAPSTAIFFLPAMLRAVSIPLARSVVLLLTGAALLTSGCGQGKGPVSKNPLVITPALALEAVPGKPLFYNGPALSWLQQKRQDLLSPEELQPMAPRSKAFAQAVQNPKLFRQLDRQHRFDSLLLVGDPSQYRPLLDHLLESGDWRVTYLDHTSLIFRRNGTKAWESGALEAVQARLTGLSPREEALVLSQMASKLVALRKPDIARQLLTQAEKKDDRLPDVWSTWGQLHLALGDFKAAETAADRALGIDPETLPALGVKAQALYATKRFVEAYRHSAKLLTARPEDPGILFYHAKIAHEARQYPDEIEAMKKLIKLAESNGGRVDPGYRVYLGQAYAKNGEAIPALAQLATALKDPELPMEQRLFAEETQKLIQQKVAPENEQK